MPDNSTIALLFYHTKLSQQSPERIIEDQTIQLAFTTFDLSFFYHNTQISTTENSESDSDTIPPLIDIDSD